MSNIRFASRLAGRLYACSTLMNQAEVRSSTGSAAEGELVDLGQADHLEACVGDAEQLLEHLRPAGRDCRPRRGPGASRRTTAGQCLQRPAVRERASSIVSSTSSSTIPMTSSPESRSSARSASRRAVGAPPPTSRTRRGARAACCTAKSQTPTPTKVVRAIRRSEFAVDPEPCDPETEHRERRDPAERRDRRDCKHADGEPHRTRGLSGPVADRRPDDERQERLQGGERRLRQKVEGRRRRRSRPSHRGRSPGGWTPGCGGVRDPSRVG